MRVNKVHKLHQRYIISDKYRTVDKNRDRILKAKKVKLNELGSRNKSAYSVLLQAWKRESLIALGSRQSLPSYLRPRSAHSVSKSKKWREDSGGGRDDVECSGKVVFRMVGFLAADETRKAIFWPAPGLKARIFDSAGIFEGGEGLFFLMRPQYPSERKIEKRYGEKMQISELERSKSVW